jgi:hypothetical protein
MTVKVKGDMLFKDTIYLYFKNIYITNCRAHTQYIYMTCTNQSSPPIPCVLPATSYQYQSTS